MPPNGQDGEHTRRRRQARPVQLNDRDWLAERYERASSGEIGIELGVDPQQVVAALHRLGIPVRTGVETLRRRQPLLHDDTPRLQQRVAQTSVAAVATELGVARITVQTALSRKGGQSAHRFNGITPMQRPADSTLEAWWSVEGTIKGVARRCEVSVNTAAIWLAQVGIFVSDSPAIARIDLERAISNGDSLKAIRARHRVTDRTVVVELHRQGLFDSHRRRHMPNQD